jgi:predicted deacetylase
MRLDYRVYYFFDISLLFWSGIGYSDCGLYSSAILHDGIMAKTNEFIICIHDVCPQASTPVLKFLDSLNGLVGTSLSIAVIPLPYNERWRNEDKVFVDELQGRTEEVLLHGLTHKRVANKSPLSFLIENADELTGLSTTELDSMLGQGQDIVSELFGSRAKGFVPPGWQAGSMTGQLLDKHGLDFIVTLCDMTDVKGDKVGLASWSWDCGRIPLSGYLGEAIGSVLYWRGDVVPCVVLHPKDIERGFMSRSLRRIQSFLEKGYRPISFNKLYNRMASDAD